MGGHSQVMVIELQDDGNGKMLAEVGRGDSCMARHDSFVNCFICL